MFSLLQKRKDFHPDATSADRSGLAPMAGWLYKLSSKGVWQKRCVLLTAKEAARRALAAVGATARVHRPPHHPAPPCPAPPRPAPPRDRRCPAPTALRVPRAQPADGSL